MMPIIITLIIKILCSNLRISHDQRVASTNLVSLSLEIRTAAGDRQAHRGRREESSYLTLCSLADVDWVSRQVWYCQTTPTRMSDDLVLGRPESFWNLR